MTGLNKSLTEKFGNTLELSNFYSPKGLNIGGNSDEEYYGRILEIKQTKETIIN